MNAVSAWSAASAQTQICASHNNCTCTHTVFENMVGWQHNKPQQKGSEPLRNHLQHQTAQKQTLQRAAVQRQGWLRWQGHQRGLVQLPPPTDQRGWAVLRTLPAQMPVLMLRLSPAQKMAVLRTLLAQTLVLRLLLSPVQKMVQALLLPTEQRMVQMLLAQKLVQVLALTGQMLVQLLLLLTAQMLMWTLLLTDQKLVQLRLLTDRKTVQQCWTE